MELVAPVFRQEGEADHVMDWLDKSGRPAVFRLGFGVNESLRSYRFNVEKNHLVMKSQHWRAVYIGRAGDFPYRNFTVSMMVRHEIMRRFRGRRRNRMVALVSFPAFIRLDSRLGEKLVPFRDLFCTELYWEGGGAPLKHHDRGWLELHERYFYVCLFETMVDQDPRHIGSYRGRFGQWPEQGKEAE